MNIIIFGPNGSGKGTQGAIIQKKYNIPHIESGVIFRENIKKQTPLGVQAKEYIDRGVLVPDGITIPMILHRLKEDDCSKGWLLDGFPRNSEQAKVLNNSMNEFKVGLDFVVEITLDREIAKKRIMGRRICENDGNHPNNIFIEAIKPAENNGEMICRVCGGKLNTRSDDQDEEAINKRHDIYYDNSNGTLAAVQFFKDLSREKNGKPEIVVLDGTPDVERVSESLLTSLK